MTSPSGPPPRAFTRYERFVIALLAFLQFTIILDFMTLSPLGAIRACARRGVSDQKTLCDGGSRVG